MDRKHGAITEKLDSNTISKEALRRRYVRLCRPLAAGALVVGSLPLSGPLALLCVTLSLVAFAYVIKTSLDYYDSQVESLVPGQKPQGIKVSAEVSPAHTARYAQKFVFRRTLA